ncbi:MAG: 50S ribosomal protein L25 [Phycisphaerales bacterium]|nr:MAG: 50S ribosomal protein L25 [Phycisphaerales bacterium]
MNKTATLTAKRRERVGSRYARRIRESGGLPAVLYGHGADPLALTLDLRDTVRHVLAGEKVFGLAVEGESAEATVLLKDIQYDFLGDSIIHLDFARVDLDEEVEVHVPVHLVGDAVGLKSAGSVLLHPITELTIRCKVTSIPDFIEVNIADLDVGHSIHLREVTIPAGIEVLDDPEAVLATIHTKTEEPTAEETAVAGEGAEPEVIREKKDGDDEDAKE